ELVELGARWIGSDEAVPFTSGAATPAYVTRMHVRYDAKSFPEDLAFVETNDRENFQARFVLNHRWQGDATCTAAEHYRAALPTRARKEAENLAALTGWSRQEVDAR